MEKDITTTRYKKIYSNVVRLFPKPYYDRFGEGMIQTFTDIVRERQHEGKGILTFILWSFYDTFIAIIMERINYTLQSYRMLRILLITALLLSIPLIAMQFTDEVNWNLFDFVIMGTMLLGVGFAYELVSKKGRTVTYRAALGIGLLGIFLMVWVNGAVGIIGGEGQPANLLFGMVCLVGLVGSFVAHFKPRGMSHTLIAAAITQMLVPVVALIFWPPPATSWSPSIIGVFLLSGFFAVLFFVSAMLFRYAYCHDEKSGEAIQK